VLEPGEAALGYALAQVMVMAGTGILCLYPLARHFGPAEHRGPVGRLIVSSLFDSRSLALWAAGAGLLAAVLRWPFPEALFERWSVMDVLFYAGPGLSHFGIGLRLELAEPWRDWRAHGLVALAKFGLIPVLSGLFLVGLTWAGWPLSGLLAEVVWLQAFMPTAILSVMIANLFHLDGRLASSIWFWNTLGFLVFVAPVLLLLGR